MICISALSVVVLLASCVNDKDDKSTVKEQNKKQGEEQKVTNVEKEENENKDEIDNYVKYMYGDMLKYHNEIITYYEQIIEEPDEVFYSTIINDIIPLYSEVLTELETMTATIQNEELKQTHQFVIQAVKTQLEGFYYFKQAYESQNTSFVDAGNAKIKEANYMFVTYDEKINLLLVRYDVPHPIMEH
jgi:PBP1b-binding outer membrane lipoprotein LpoB